MAPCTMTVAGLALTAALIACGGSAASNAPGPSDRPTEVAPTLTPAAVAASPTAAPGALPSPDLAFKAEDCPADDVCRRVAVARIPGIPFTTAVPCRANGTTCELYFDLYYPVAPPAGGTPYPVAVWEPGGPEVPGTATVGALLLAGQGVVVFDGSWRQSPEFGGGGTVGLRDIACTILAARSLGAGVGGEPGRVTLVGYSMGGWGGSVLALTPGGLKPDSAQCRFDQGDPAPDAFAGLAGGYIVDDTWEFIVGVARAADPELWASLDPIALIERYGAPTIPLVLMQGDPDGIVRLDVPQRLAEALTAAGLPTTVAIEPGVGHAQIPTAPATIRALLELLRPG